MISFISSLFSRRFFVYLAAVNFLTRCKDKQTVYDMQTLCEYLTFCASKISNMTKKERLEELINHYTSGNKAQFAKKIGITPQGLSTWLARNMFDIDLVYSKCEGVSPQWLLTGEGDMLKSEKFGIDNSITQTDPVSGKNYVPPTAPLNATSLSQHKRSDRERESIPLVSEKAVGGFYNDDFYISERDIIGFYVIPKFRHLGVDFMIEVIGDSMLPRFFPGDIIACSMIPNPKFIQWNKCYLIATRDQGLIIKRLMPGDHVDSLKAVSDNKDYPPFDLPKEEICGLARIVGSIHVE